MKQFFISVENVKEAARKAFKERRLQFQLIEDKKLGFIGHCAYTLGNKFPNCGCVIGVACPELQEFVESVEGRYFLQSSTSITNLIRHKIVVTDDDDFLIRLQKMHDDLCSDIHIKRKYGQNLNNFLAMIDYV